jgi:multimeric flavodoxin WrbA
MKLAVFNGSPRGQNSNSIVLMQQFLKGYRADVSSDVPVNNLANRKALTENLDLAVRAENIIVIFPLYTDCMPGIVLEFFEALVAKGSKGTQRLGFIVHSGFPESVQSEPVERYLAKFAERTGYEYLGTIIKGGTEGVRMMPEQMTRKLFKMLYELGTSFAENGSFSAEIKEALSSPRSLSGFGRFGYRLLGLTGFSKMYWNSNLRKYNAYKDRFAKPFEA